jgi:starch phosphorylase
MVHGGVAREMWKGNWPDVPVHEVPISSVTNGIHIRSWLSSDIGRLFERYLGPDWMQDPEDADMWQRVEDIPDAELWLAHERRRERLVVETRAHLKECFIRRGAPPSQIAEADELLDPEALTIGFARRFAPYKRATLLLRDEKRLLKLLTDSERPIQFVFSGKAHPRDNIGKELIKTLVQFARHAEVRHRIAFVEDYNMGIARFLVQGVDVWMNNPVKPLEASGTSGMKVPPNGGINFSVLDGWWVEGYDGINGWVIGDDRIYDNADYQDFVESESIYDILEREIIPAFYDRGPDGLPRRWIAMMKASMRTCSPRFSAVRMVREYARDLYVPVTRNGLRLAGRDYAEAKALAKWRETIAKRWNGVAIESFDAVETGERRAGTMLTVRARVTLGEIKPDDVAVQLYHGPAPINGTIAGGQVVNMACENTKADGSYDYVGAIPCTTSGRHAYAVRIVPTHSGIPGHHDMSLIKWG